MAEQEIFTPEQATTFESGIAESQKFNETVHTIENSFGGLLSGLGQGITGGFGTQLSQTDTLYYNLRWYLISNNRQLLSQLYVEHGIVQTLCDAPVDDGFRAGFEIKTGQLDGEEIEELEYFAEQNQVIAELAQACKWARLFGGGALILMTGGDPAKPLKSNELKQGEPFQFKAIDMWELYNTIQNVNGDNDLQLGSMPEFFNYYGIKVHCSRVFLIKGKQAPSFIRPRLRGWGMSEIERLIRSINSYMKNQDVVFELLDEAKVDVYKLKGFNSALMNADGTQMISNRIQKANQLKNFQRAIIMDKEEEYEQKQISFSGLPELLVQIRQSVAADVKMPMTKLFGMSAAGFSSGEDDIENYNSMIESEVRSKVKHHVVQALQICCQIKFGFVPTDLKITWKPLRILGAEEEEKVKDSQHNRVMSAYTSGLVDAEETKKAINKASLLPVEIDPDLPASEPIAGDFSDTSDSSKQKGST